MILVNEYSNRTVPNSLCPKCASPLIVKTTADRIPGGEVQNVRNFIGCSAYFSTGCNYRTKFTAETQKALDEFVVEVEEIGI